MRKNAPAHKKSRPYIKVYFKNYYAALRHIDCAFGANIDLRVYNFLCPLSLALYVRISIATCGKYRAALRHIDCSERANIDLHKYPLIHRRRDDGPPSPQRLLLWSQSGEGWYRNAFDFPSRGRRRVAETGNRSVNADGRVLFRT